ncbi:hypothetical protein F4775DRAFT_377432 [Biscogniauxia sp. FL1348]|nr:hypothetical protein F4775DRAFT_377432 [Biscogniauxia sp. FL1348]
MDPFAAISFCCNVLDLVDRSIKVFNTCKRIYESPDGQDHESLHDATKHVEELIAAWDTYRSKAGSAGQNNGDNAIADVLATMERTRIELQLILDICKAKKTRNLSATAAAFLRSWKNKEALEKSRSRLVECQKQFNSLLIARISRQTDNIIGILDQFGNTQNDIRDTLQVVSRNLSIQNVEEVRGASENAKQRIIAQQILQALQAPSERYDMVKDAAKDTYEWLFQDSNTTPIYDDTLVDGKSDSSRLEVSKRFTRWLHYGTGIFHVSGKPGSGKSVLMKFIMEHKCTKEFLRKWAEGKRLVHSKFFFWKPGDWRQNSLRGLVRGILYDVLDNQPDLVSILFPRWSTVTLGSRSALTGLTVGLPEKDCSDAFQRLLEAEEILKETRMCFFIDGLDELEESHGYAYTYLVQKLWRWSDRSKGRVKLCVSSRELPEFENLSPGNKIRLHELTASDIHEYVHDTLLKDLTYCEVDATHPEGCSDLVRKIVQESDGVFLWTVLVVQSVLKGIANKDSLSTLKCRIEAMPKQLEDMFNQIWDSIDECYRWEVVIILAILVRRYGILVDGRSVLVDDRSVFSWLNFELHLDDVTSFLEALDSSISIKETFKTSHASIRREDFAKLAPKTIARINGRWNGLLQIECQESKSRVELSHRSIVEFMETRLPQLAQIQGIMNSDVETTVSWMVAERINTIVIDIKLPNDSMRTLIDTLGETTFNLLTYLVVSNRRLSNDTLELLDHIDQTLVEQAAWLSHGLFVHTIFPEIWGTNFWESISWIVGFASMIGLSQFLSWKFTRYSSILSGDHYLRLLPFAYLCVHSGLGDISDTLTVLHDHGVDFKSKEPAIGGLEITWFDMLWAVLCLDPARIQERDGPSSPWYGLEAWLKYGAKPTVLISMKRPKLPQKCRIISNVYTKIHFLCGETEESDQTTHSTGSDAILILEKPPGYYGWPDDREQITFEDFVNHWNPPNRDSILAILHAQDKDDAAQVTEDSPGADPPDDDDEPCIPGALKEEEEEDDDDGQHKKDAAYRHLNVPVWLFCAVAAPVLAWGLHIWTGAWSRAQSGWPHNADQVAGDV